MTGAGGFVAHELLKGANEKFVAVTRNNQLRARMPAHIQTISLHHIDDSTEWSKILRPGDDIVHLAGIAHQSGRSQSAVAEYRRVNVESTRALMTAARQRDARRVVFVSTALVHGQSVPPNRPITPDSELCPEGPYAVSKLEAEDVVRASSIPFVIFRPPVMHGPGMRGNLGRLIRLIQRGFPLPVAQMKSPRSLLSVEAFCQAMLISLEKNSAAGRVFTLADDRPLSIAEVASIMGEAVGRPARLIGVPPFMLRSAAIVTGRRADWTRVAEPLVVDSTSAIKGLGWKPRDAKDALAASTRANQDHSYPSKGVRGRS